MRFVLLSSDISGIKNISTTAHIQYTNKMTSTIDLEKGCIKAIYGGNGAGKSGICHAYDVLRRLLTEESVLKDPVFVDMLSELINKKTGLFSVENRYLVLSKDGVDHSYYHHISVSLSDGYPVVIEERLGLLTSRGDPGRTIFHIKQGQILTATPDVPLAKEDVPFLRFSSFVPYIVMNKNSDDKNKNVYVHIALAYLFAANIAVVFGSNADTHESLYIKASDKLSKALPALAKGESIRRIIGVRKERYGKYYWHGNPEDKDDVKKRVKRMVPFLQAMNDALIDVEPIFEDEPGISHMKLKFHYDGYVVDYEFESTGVQKAVRLFDAFYHASRGGISIIDEIDAGIHDVFITKLVEFFSLYGEGQIVMTTHNVNLMGSLKHHSRGIDFLSYDGTIVPWVQRGDASPEKAFLHGAIKHLPFNLQSADFGPVFFGDE